MKAELIHDRDNETGYRVEAVDDDGGCEVAIFSGPNALVRAIMFASAIGYYDEWDDRTETAMTHDRIVVA